MPQIANVLCYFSHGNVRLNFILREADTCNCFKESLINDWIAKALLFPLIGCTYKVNTLSGQPHLTATEDPFFPQPLTLNVETKFVIRNIWTAWVTEQSCRHQGTFVYRICYYHTLWVLYLQRLIVTIAIDQWLSSSEFVSLVKFQKKFRMYMSYSRQLTS